LLNRGKIDLVTVWSSRGAAILARQLANSGAKLQDTDLLAISPAAAQPLGGSGFRRILVAEAPDGAAMLAKIRAYSTPEPE
jgi:uroporphyrinogen-III synthase